jgi:hypothetical protein
VFQGERVNCEDNTSLGEFTLAPIPPMKAGEAVLEVIFEVDVNGILKVTATEKTSGRSANITISNSVGKLSSGEIETMINDAAKFKTSDEAFSKRFESRQQLEAYIARVEEMISDPTSSLKLKQNQRKKIEDSLSDAMAQLEIEDANAEDLKKKVCSSPGSVLKAPVLTRTTGTRSQAYRHQGICDSLDLGSRWINDKWRRRSRGSLIFLYAGLFDVLDMMVHTGFPLSNLKVSDIWVQCASARHMGMDHGCAGFCGDSICRLMRARMKCIFPNGHTILLLVFYFAFQWHVSSLRGPML